MKTRSFFFALLLATALCSARPGRMVIVDQDCAGPGGRNLQTVALMIQSPQVELLGVTVVSGDQWRDEEVAHTLRLLEIVRRTYIVAGAAFPLVRRRDETQLWQQCYGKVAHAGRLGRSLVARTIGCATSEGGNNQRRRTSEEDAAHILLRRVRKCPHQVKIYEGGPMTNLGVAIGVDPDFPSLAAGWHSWELA